MCPELSAFSNSEYAYAIYPVTIALFWDKGGEEICFARPLSLIFTILPRCLNTTGLNNYSVRATRKWSCGDTFVRGSAPLAPLGDFEKYPNGSKPRIVGETAPETFYQSLFASVLATLWFKSTSCGTARGRENLAATEFPECGLVKKGFRAVNLLTCFVTSGGDLYKLIF